MKDDYTANSRGITFWTLGSERVMQRQLGLPLWWVPRLCTGRPASWPVQLTFGSVAELSFFKALIRIRLFQLCQWPDTWFVSRKATVFSFIALDQSHQQLVEAVIKHVGIIDPQNVGWRDTAVDERIRRQLCIWKYICKSFDDTFWIEKLGPGSANSV